MEKRKILKVDEADNVLVALQDLPTGSISFEGKEIPLTISIPQKHKFLTEDLKKGEKVIMYGVPVGTVTEDLAIGSLLTTENLKHFANPIELDSANSYQWKQPKVDEWQTRTFDGYHRADGKVGTANYWLFVPLVFCENRNLKVIEQALTKGLGYSRPNKYEQLVKEEISETTITDAETSTEKRFFKNIDGIKFLYHHGGCGGTRDDAEALLRLLAGYVSHPNVAGATVLSLGCQHAQIDWFNDIRKQLYPEVEKPIIFFEQQDVKSEEVLITRAIQETLAQLKEANKIERKPAPLSQLVVGLECGGSDGFSGISANPSVGVVSDWMTCLGGASILSEFPELNGVEQNIIDRCSSKGVAEKFVKIQQAYEARARSVGSGFDMNPSPGNIKDGLISDAIKSAGAAKKGGNAPVADVLDYGEPVVNKGLNLLCTPGNDVESTTAMVGSGANIVLFTTGLGTPTGNPIAPIIKISSNTELSNRMNDIIDVDAGPITAGESTIEEIAKVILEKIIEVASGKPTKAMQLDQNDFIPWKRGVSL